MLVYLSEVIGVEFVHANEHRTARMTIIPMTAPEEVCPILIVAEKLQTVQPEQLPTALRYGELYLRLGGTELALSRSWI